MDKDAFYFPHFSNAKSDRKLLRVRKELGIEGYGIYFMILETLREQEKYKYPMKDIDLLADEYGTSEQKVRTVVCNYGLFEINNEDDFFSPRFVLYLQPYLINKKRKRINGIKGNLIRYGHITKDKMKAMSDEDILLLHNKLHDGSLSDRIGIASKVKESKVKKSKANIYKIPTVEEISKYCEERKNGIDSEHFHDFYSSKGWMIGKNKMKDWKAAVRTWEKNNSKKPPEEKMNIYKPMFTELIDREYAEMYKAKQEREA